MLFDPLRSYSELDVCDIKQDGIPPAALLEHNAILVLVLLSSPSMSYIFRYIFLCPHTKFIHQVFKAHLFFRRSLQADHRGRPVVEAAACGTTSKPLAHMRLMPDILPSFPSTSVSHIPIKESSQIARSCVELTITSSV